MDRYDYIISLPLAPAFDDKLSIMFTNLDNAGVDSPTLIKRATGLLDGLAMPGTADEETLGKHMFFFRLPQYYDATELNDLLYNGVSSPRPPYTIEFCRSAEKINAGDYDVKVAPLKDKFVPYMVPVVDDIGDPPTTPPTYRPVTIDDEIYLGLYMGTDPVLLPPETP